MDILGIVCMLITPVVFLIIGIVFSIHPSKQINDYSGHRTKLSKKSGKLGSCPEAYGKGIFDTRFKFYLVVGGNSGFFDC